jgi:hypothetical protein
MAVPSIAIDRIFAAVPATTRGQPTQLSADSKGQRLAYAVGLHPFPRPSYLFKQSLMLVAGI